METILTILFLAGVYKLIYDAYWSKPYRPDPNFNAAVAVTEGHPERGLH